MFFKIIQTKIKMGMSGCSLVDELGSMNTEKYCFCSSLPTFLTTCLPTYTHILIDLHKASCFPTGTLKSTIYLFMVWIHSQFICWFLWLTICPITCQRLVTSSLRRNYCLVCPKSNYFEFIVMWNKINLSYWEAENGECLVFLPQISWQVPSNQSADLFSATEM